jgi:hypothetical protein
MTAAPHSVRRRGKSQTPNVQIPKCSEPERMGCPAFRPLPFDVSLVFGDLDVWDFST